MSNNIQLQFGNVQNKNIQTNNDFISHMIEHIAWRMGCSIDLEWPDDNWYKLGEELGKTIKQFQSLQFSAACLGMIDDGVAQVKVDLNERGFSITSNENVDLDFFLNCRCEQVKSGKELLELLKGISYGLEANIAVKVLNFEDPHHTWEGIYRAVGIALSKIYTSLSQIKETDEEFTVEKEENENNEIQVLEASINYANVLRGTAESGVMVGVDFTQQRPNKCNIIVADSIKEVTKDIYKLLDLLSLAAGFTLQVEFKAKILSSSHVVLEDIGLVLGRALLEILKLRMEQYGVNGAGSNIQKIEDTSKNVQVGISVEGRKFWRYVLNSGEYTQLKQKFLINQTVFNSILSEDLDDFIDGLAGGLTASLVFAIEDYSDSDKVWQELFAGLGEALNESFQCNPARVGVPPGVKATLN